jgi:hypothetical protein
MEYSSTENGNFFIFKDSTEGKVAIGKVPTDLHEILNTIATEYYNEIPAREKKKATYHTWFDNMSPNIKKKVELVQNNPFWDKLCDNSEKCVRINAKEMDELYYSNPPNNLSSVNLYGAAGNYDIHRDCIFNFSGIKFYRVLIGLTDGNDNITTYFNNLNTGHKINKHDFIVFDFDNTTHQVIKEKQKSSSRILLKLHYIVCENCKYSRATVNKFKNAYIYYEFITRYFMQTGTDPETFYQFFVGLFCQGYMINGISFIILFYIILILMVLYVFNKVKFIGKNIFKILSYIASTLLVTFTAIVLFFWIRYSLTGIR